jgi:hypothetical protein
MATNAEGSNLLLTGNAFSKCAPNITSNIKECGSVTICNAKAMTQAELQNFTRGTDYLVMGSLIQHDFEIKMCAAVQNGLYDFLMSNKQNWNSKARMQKEQLAKGSYRIRPFLLARQYNPINNAYWIANNIVVQGSNLRIDASSSTNIPPDIRSFPTDMYLYLQGATAGGAVSRTSWIVVSAVLINNAVRITMSPANAGSFLPAANQSTAITTGVLTRGTPNKSDFEKWCNEQPAYLNWNEVPFWVDTSRTTMCRSSQYDDYVSMLLSENPLFKEFGYLPEAEKNRQLGEDWQRRMVEKMMWGQAKSASQTVAAYNNLEDITAFDGGTLGVDGATCVGKRADMIGVFQQLVQCGRYDDLLGAQLNLISLFNELYNISRVRQGAGNPNFMTIDVFTDNVTAHAINQAMITYYSNESGGLARLVMPINNSPGVSFNKDQDIQKAEFGFNYRSYNLMFPAFVRLNVVTHFFFDDYLTARVNTGNAQVANSGRLLLVLDFSNIYPAIVASNSKRWNTGDLKTLASINTDFACVLEVNTQEQQLTSVTAAMVVECPAGNLWLENFSSAVPAVTAGGPNYPATTTTTTTTSS